MGNGGCKLNVTHTLAANLCLCNLNVAALADLALVADTLIAAAVALPVLERSEDFFAEKTVAFGLEGAVIDSLGLCDLAV